MLVKEKVVAGNELVMLSFMFQVSWRINVVLNR